MHPVIMLPRSRKQSAAKSGDAAEPAHGPEMMAGPETRGHRTSYCRHWRRRVSPQYRRLPATAPQHVRRPCRCCVALHLSRELALLPLHLAPLCPCSGTHPCHYSTILTPFLRVVLSHSPRAGAVGAPRTARAAHWQTHAGLRQPADGRRQESAWPLVLQDPPGHAARQSTLSPLQHRGRHTRSLCFPATFLTERLHQVVELLRDALVHL